MPEMKRYKDTSEGFNFPYPAILYAVLPWSKENNPRLYNRKFL